MEITMEYSYFSDSLQNYLVLECPEQKDRMNYQYRMLSVNTIRGLLPSSIRTIDGIQYLYYDITSRQDLQSLYTDRYIPDQMWQCLLRCLARTGKTLSRFLLDEKRLLLAPEFIYYDFGRDTFYFTYYPEALEECSGLHLLKYLSDCVDPALPSAEVLGRLCVYAQNPNFVLTEELLDALLEQHAQNTPAREEGLCAQDNFPDADTATGDFQDSSFVDERAFTDMPDDDPFPEDEPPAPTRYMHGKSGRSSYTSGQDAGYRQIRTGSKTGHKQSRSSQDADDNQSRGAYETGYNHDMFLAHVRDPERQSREAVQPDSLSVTLKAAVILLVTAAVLELLAQRILFPQVPLDRYLLPIQAGAITSLTVSVCLAVYSVYLTVRGRKEARMLELEQQENARMNATVPSMEYRSSPQAITPEEEDWYDTRDAYSYDAADGISGDSVYSGAYDTFGAGSAAGQKKAPPPAPQNKLYGQGESRQYRIDLNRLPCVVGQNREFVDMAIPAASVSALHARFFFFF